MTGSADEILDKVASNLRGDDIKAMALVSRRMHGVLLPHIARLHATESASRVSDSDAFDAAMDSIYQLREDLQPEPLLRIGKRLHVIPQDDVNDQHDAIGEFLWALAQLPKRYHTESLNTLNTSRLAAIAAYGSADAAIRGGEKVQAVAMFFNADPGLLESLAHREVALPAVRAGESHQQVAERLGIQHGPYVYQLNLTQQQVEGDARMQAIRQSLNS